MVRGASQAVRSHNPRRIGLAGRAGRPPEEQARLPEEQDRTRRA